MKGRAACSPLLLCQEFLEDTLGLKLITAASAGAVTLDAAKIHCGIESSDWNQMLEGFILAATAMAQHFTSRRFGSQTWELELDDFADEIELLRGPVTGITSITYLDENRALQTLSTDVYIADLVSDPQRIVRDPDASWPGTADVPNAVIIRFVTGFAGAPDEVQQAVLMTVESWRQNRASGPIPPEALALLRPSRLIRI
jgi:uncharacterized phiE125 gp8 family phage protein